MINGYITDPEQVATQKCVHDGTPCVELAQCLDCPIWHECHPQFAPEGRVTDE